MEEENKCGKCKQKGLCCCHVVKESGILYILPSQRCHFLLDDMSCSIYEDRHELNAECASMEKLSAMGGIPPKCEYKKDYDFPLKVRVASPRNEKRLIKKFKELHGIYTT